MRYISLFSGIAGLDRAIDALGGECWVQVEKEPYCRSILDLRYPDVPKVDNIFGWHATADTVDLVIGGPPCQPVSHAGRRKGQDDERWLWGEALRIVAEAKPERVFFENPMGLRTMGLDIVLAGLTELGYGGAWEVVAAADVGAPHLRKRIFIMGIRGRSGWDGPTRPKGNHAVVWSPTHRHEWDNSLVPNDPPATRRCIYCGEIEPTNRLWPTPHGNTGDGKGGAFDGHGSELSQAVLVAEGLSDSERSAKRVPNSVLWPTPTASGERPNEGNVRLLRARVLAGDMTEQEAAGMLNGKSPFGVQGKVPALWPTPVASDHLHNDSETPEAWARRSAQKAEQGIRLHYPLRIAAQERPGPLVPTPSHADGTGGPGTSPKREGGLNLRTFVDHWPTPTSRDYKDTGDSIADGTVPINGLLGRAVGPTRERGALNPSWVEWLMNLPIGWTDIDCAEPGPLYGWESEPAIPRVGLGIPNRPKRLTALGNAVVPAQAVFAWKRLEERLG